MIVSTLPITLFSVAAEDSSDKGGITAETVSGDYAALSNTLYKLQNDSRLTVGYIGDSIGAGQTTKYASDSEFLNYKSRNAGAYQVNSMVFTKVFTDWLSWYADKELNVSDADIDAYYSAIGGATVAQALSYVREDICAYTPDLVVIEMYNSISNSEMYMESLIQQIYASNPYCDIIVFSAGGQCGTWSELLDYYGIPFIDGSAEMIKYFSRSDIFGSGASFNANREYYFGDYPHTNEEGYHRKDLLANR